MLRTVVAIERDGLDVRVLSLQFDVPNAEFDLKDAVCKASTDYCKTQMVRELTSTTVPISTGLILL